MPKLRHAALAAALLTLSTHDAEAQRRQRGPDHERGALPVHEAPDAAGIAWFGTWEGALTEAKRTGRPILFQSAAPQCQSVPGVW
ncbi:MAG: hypothetical protein AAFZ87_19605 [Planctomycetota bacterium]